MSHPVIRFPPPPPTCNDLSTEQRAQLMRTHKKIGQLLGSTPHVLDFSYSSAQSHPVAPAHPPKEKSRRSIFKRHRRSKSSSHAEYDSDDDARPTSRTLLHARPSTSHSTRSSSESHPSSSSNEQAWRTPYHPLQRPPLLKLFPANSASSASSTSTPHPDSPDIPTFSITSEAALRRTKMQRLTRKLGEGVPPELVFPSPEPAADDDCSSDDEPSALTTPASDRAQPFTLPPIPEDEHTSPRTKPGMRHEASLQPPRRSSFAADKAKRLSYRDAVYVVDSPDEHGLATGFEGLCISVQGQDSRKAADNQGMTCVGVSASAGPDGQGRSRRWMRGDIAYDQIVAPWHGNSW